MITGQFGRRCRGRGRSSADCRYIEVQTLVMPSISAGMQRAVVGLRQPCIARQWAAVVELCGVPHRGRRTSCPSTRSPMTSVPTPTTPAANPTATLDALPAVSDATSLQFEQAMRKAGFDAGLVWITARESADELQALVDSASPLAGVGDAPPRCAVMSSCPRADTAGCWCRWKTTKQRSASLMQRARGATLAVRCCGQRHEQ